MALSIKALNNDTSFLLTFAPSITPSDVKTPELFPGAYTILIDPWLSGPATIVSQKLSVQEHTTPSCIDTLRDLPEPDMVLISQEKPDHCHEETLCQLSPHARSVILGPVKACKKIKRWQHFDFSCIQCLKPYNPRDLSTVFRVEIPAFSANGTPGELTVCLLEPKRDMSGVHNAIGLTYRPPASVLSLNLSSYKAIAQTLPLSAVGPPPPLPFDTPTPPVRPRTSPGLGSNPAPETTRPTTAKSGTRPTTPKRPLTSKSVFGRSDNSNNPPTESRPITPRFVSARANTIVPSPNPITHQTEKTVSVLYTPHGVPYQAVQPWASTHLVSLAAHPLTLFLHGFDSVYGPWYVGGVMTAGLPGGLDIVRQLLPRVWLGAHDGEKKIRGAVAKKVQRKNFALDEVEKAVGEALSANGKAARTITEVVRLGSGKELRLGFRGLDGGHGKFKVM